MVLIDKGYYDYDFERYIKPIDASETVLSEDKINSFMKKFGFGGSPQVSNMNIEELQSYAMNDINNKK